jgi:hypothetical protein
MSMLFSVHGVYNKENKGYFSMLNNSYSETSLITKVTTIQTIYWAFRIHKT